MYGNDAAPRVFDIHLNVMSKPPLVLLNCSKTWRSTFNFRLFPVYFKELAQKIKRLWGEDYTVTNDGAAIMLCCKD